MQVSDALLPRRAVPALRVRHLQVTETRVVFFVSLLIYLAAGAFLVFVGNVILGDALARVENIDRVLYSRDPHLAAIGFNFPPLPQFFYLPFIPLKALWPDLIRDGFIGNVYSAVFMAGAACQVCAFMREIGLRRLPRVAITAIFALHPMVLYSGADGMTEASSLFFLLAASRYLVRWLRTDEVVAQVLTGAALALAFLTRYEALFSGLAVMALAGVMVYRRQRGEDAVSAGLGDALILGGPFLLAVGGWVAGNWMIMGSPLAEVSNAYGTAQLHIPDVQRGHLLWLHAFSGILTMEPLLPVILVAAVVAALLWGGQAFAPPVVVFAPVLAFMYWGWATVNILDSLRYLITAVPLATLLAGALLSSLSRRDRHESDTAGTSMRGIRRAIAMGPVACFVLPLMLSAAILPAAVGMWQHDGEGASGLAVIFNPTGATDKERRAARRLFAEREIASYLDMRYLPRGSVLVDDFAGFAIFLNSDNPDQFVITSDRDFQGALVDPAGANVQYILVPEPRGIALLEAVNRTYPGFYESGGGISALVQEFPQSSDGTVWRLYQVTRPS